LGRPVTHAFHVMPVEDGDRVVTEAREQRRQTAGQRVIHAQFVDLLALGFDPRDRDEAGGEPGTCREGQGGKCENTEPGEFHSFRL